MRSQDDFSLRLPRLGERRPDRQMGSRGLPMGRSGVLLRDYEVTFIVSTALDEEATAAVIERVNHLIAAGDGSVTEVHAWGRRRLAYPIAHNRDGFYVTTRFSMPTEAMSAFENDLRLNENILRHGAFRQDEVPIRPVLPVAAAPAAEARRPEHEADLAEDIPVLEEEGIDPDLVPAAED
jgi:small subunit ribosomal protein S6